MAYDRMSDIREKIKRADKHIADFKLEVRKFNGSDPYSIRVDMETESGRPIVHVLKVKPIPQDISLIAGDAIQNLRSALDYLACRSVDGWVSPDSR
jgi:hypothetical protein